MDQQQEPTTSNSSLFQLNLDAQNSYNLRSSATWAKVLGVCGIILGLFFTIVCLVALGNVGKENYRTSRGSFQNVFGSYETAQRMGLWIFIITGIIFIVGGVFAFSFGNRINAALRSNDQHVLNAGFAALRNYYAVRSITLIICILFLLLGLAGSL
jgi:hypothetical protein